MRIGVLEWGSPSRVSFRVPLRVFYKGVAEGGTVRDTLRIVTRVSLRAYIRVTGRVAIKGYSRGFCPGSYKGFP